jgi:hypothetical protein
VATLLSLAALVGLLAAVNSYGGGPNAEPPIVDVVNTVIADPSSTTTVPPTTVPSTPAPTTSSNPPAAAPTTTPAVAAAPSVLDRLTIAAPHVGSVYRRAAFGEDWIDVDRDCHNTRAEVLMTETLDPVTFNPNGCTVNTGRWIDPWDGFASTRASDFQIDHTVPLAEAWRSGAWAWSDARRAAFAQNLDDPDELNALKSAVNSAKSDRSPDQWKPPLRASWCRYATAWARIKADWGLTVTQPEHDALATMLGTCTS